MSAVFCPAQKLSVIEGSQTAQAQIARATIDAPGAVWRSNGLNGVYAVLQTSGAFDTVALVSNLRATDTIRVRTGASASLTATSPVIDRTIAAWSGETPIDGAISVLLLDSVTAGTFVRLDISSPGNPAGYVEVQRIIIGSRVETEGVILASKQSWDDGSKIEDGGSWTTVDEKRDRMTWETGVDNIKEAQWHGPWTTFLRYVKKAKGFLFIPETTSPYLQRQATFGQFTNYAGASKSSDFWVIDMKIKQV